MRKPRCPPRQTFEPNGVPSTPTSEGNQLQARELIGEHDIEARTSNHAIDKVPRLQNSPLAAVKTITAVCQQP